MAPSNNLKPTSLSALPVPLTPIAVRTSSSSSNIGPIVGGVIGGLALICLCGVLILYVRKRNGLDSSAKQKPNVLPLSGKNHTDDHHHRDPEDPGPNNNEEPTPDDTPTVDETLSAYAVPVSFQDMPPATPTKISQSSTKSSVAENDATPKDHLKLPAFKDQARSVEPTPSFYLPTVDATPVEDRDLDLPHELDDIGETRNRPRGVDP